ncbi:hypothetical protein GCM10027517_03350 [Phycicoccus ginsengisoli]
MVFHEERKTHTSGRMTMIDQSVRTTWETIVTVLSPLDAGLEVGVGAASGAWVRGVRGGFATLISGPSPW